MLNALIKNLSILKKFLFVNFVFFIIIGTFTVLYLTNVQPILIKKKTANEKFKKDRDNCKTFFDEDIGYTKCMKSKGWTKRFFN